MTVLYKYLVALRTDLIRIGPWQVTFNLSDEDLVAFWHTPGMYAVSSGCDTVWALSTDEIGDRIFLSRRLYGPTGSLALPGWWGAGSCLLVRLWSFLYTTGYWFYQVSGSYLWKVQPQTRSWCNLVSIDNTRVLRPRQVENVLSRYRESTHPET